VVYRNSQGARLDTNFRPQNRGAVSKRARNQIERQTIANYCKLFNEFLPYALRLTFDLERADERKLALKPSSHHPLLAPSGTRDVPPANGLKQEHAIRYRRWRAQLPGLR
jgi:hypothetical protein